MLSVLPEDMKEIDITAKSLDGLRKAITRIANQIEAPKDLLPTFGHSQGFAHPHIEVDPAGLHFVVEERGHEFERKTTSDPNELAYWIFQFVTFEMAVSFELNNRVEGQDGRRLLFQKQEALLGTLDSSWQRRREEEHRRILESHPFDDTRFVKKQKNRKDDTPK